MRFSVIIPATNEERFIQTAIDSVQEQGVDAEIIVVVNGSNDTTADIARSMQVRVLVYQESLLAGGARNKGAQVARGATCVFLDADSVMGDGVLISIASLAEGCFGTVLGAPLEPKLRYRLFFALKNAAHRTGMYHGVLGGLFFCPSKLFHKVGGYDASLMVNEISDIIEKIEAVGGEYTVLTNCRASTSMRRFERVGLVQALVFWTWVKCIWFWRDRRARIGATYASAHDRLFE
ncbi:MAG TPA: glycosyltransferase [Candidatus Paceibacterota bacterium]